MIVAEYNNSIQAILLLENKDKNKNPHLQKLPALFVFTRFYARFYAPHNPSTYTAATSYCNIILQHHTATSRAST